MFCLWFVVRVVVGFSGASGVVYGVRLVDVLVGLGHRVWVVVSRGGLRVGVFECGKGFEGFLRERAEGFCWGDDWGCVLASGSFSFDAVVVAPCSLKTLSAVANGFADNVLVRAALNALRLGRRLVLVVRETPWSRVDFENAARVVGSGGIVMPASPAFYHGPRKIMDLVDYVVGRVLDVLGVKHGLYAGWEEARTRGPLDLCGLSDG